METTLPTVGDHLRAWRQRRRMSQLDLALEAEISTRHLSFLETGRSSPSREMVLRLAERLELPLRERNLLLAAAGYAPVFSERPLGDPALATARRAVDLILKGHEPYPALAVDRRWTLVAANAAVPPLLDGCDPALLHPPVNVLRLSLHPAGLAPRIVNWAQWRRHLLSRLRRQVELTADPALVALFDELEAFPAPAGTSPHAFREDHHLFVPLRLASAAETLSFFSTTTVFGTPTEVTLSELALEAFFPADEATAAALSRASAARDDRAPDDGRRSSS
jgi:transcriptional regulator with XRE-family HTH domain